MGLELLARVRRTSAWVAGIAALVIATYAAPARGLAVALGTAWSLVNLALLERLIVALTGPDRRTVAATGRALAAVTGMMLLFAAGWLLLLRFPPALLMVGFGIPFAVIVLKAAALLLLPSRLWQRATRSPLLAVLALAVLVSGAWLVADSASRHDAAASATASSSALHSSTPAPPGQHGAAAAGDASGASGEHGGGHGEDAGPQKFANVITVLSRAFPDAAWARFLHHYEAVIFSLFVALLLCLVAMAATRRPQMIPGRLQNLVEMAVESLHDFIVGILGPRHGPKYLPFLGTLFLYILVMNLFGLIPFMDSPTSSLNVTVALALVVFFYSQYIGFRELGPIGWLDHMAGNPRGVVGWALVPLMLPIHLMGELAKPISLAARLFGNVFGEDMLLVAFATLGGTILAAVPVPVGLPLHAIFLPLALLTSVLQALVFTVLSTIYFLLMLPHDDHGHEEAHATQPQHAH